MTLPEIVLPKVVLPFDIPVLLHPIADHFLIALPVVVLLLELLNLVMKKKAIGGVLFFLLILTLLAATVAYFTGLTDGKEAYPALGDAAKMDLAEHKLLGTYILIGSGVLLFFKLFAMTGNKALKALYMLVLVAFVIALFKQGEEGGELVYEHGLNVEQVKNLDDEVFDLKDALEDAKAAAKKAISTTATPVLPQHTSENKKEVSVSPMVSTGVETLSATTEEVDTQHQVPAQSEVKIIPTEDATSTQE